MGFYVAVCLVAALAAIDDQHHAPTLVIVWGTTIGLALAHLFAFQFAAQIVEGVSIGRHVKQLAAAQMIGAVAVAAVVSVPALAVEAPADVEAARFVLAGVIGAPAYLLARGRGADLTRSVVFALAVLLVSSFVAYVKNALLGH